MNELKREERAHDHTIKQRDAMEQAFSDAYELVMGEPMEWSSAYGIREALDDMEDRLEQSN